MAKERKFWGGMMPISKIGKDGSGNPIGESGPAKASPAVAPVHGAKKPGTQVKVTKIDPLQKGTGEESVE